RPRVGVELRLLLDHRRQQSRIQVVMGGVAADDRRVLQRIPEPRVPGRLGVLQVDERAAEDDDEGCEEGETPQRDDESFSTTPATNASSASSEPSLTYAKSARRTFSSSRISRASRSG